MNCKHCGAALPVGAERCEYCGAATPHAAENIERILNRKKKKGLGSMKQVSGGLLFFAYFFTFGLYSGFWYLLRYKSLNRLHDRLRFPSWGALLYFFLLLGWIFSSQDVPRFWFGLSPEENQTCFNILFLLYIGVSIWLAFAARNILQNYAARHMEKSLAVLAIAPSGLMTLLFGPLYLQLQVNKMISMELLNPELGTPEE